MKKIIANFVLDKSGSMGNIQESVISGVNEYIQTLKNDKKSEYEFSLTLFNDEISMSVKGVNIRRVKNISKETYRPSGQTALYDAVVRTINSMNVGSNEKAIVIIMTDGEENSSKEYDEKYLRSLIKQKESLGNWTFVYLGANQDAFATALKFGVSTMNVSNFNATSTGTRGALGSLAMSTSAFAQAEGNSTSSFFSKKDQDNIGSM